jgi:hypothetical protein
LRNDAKDDDGIACADFVAVGESGFFYAGAVEEGAVAAVEIADAAAAGVAFKGAVDAGHTRVVGKSVFGFGGAADAQGLAQRQGPSCTLRGARVYFQKELHSWLSPPLPQQQEANYGCRAAMQS